jgi:threonine dehydratase
MGRITMNNAELAANTAVSFTMNNSLISANDTIIVNVSGGGTAAAYTTYISSMTTGSAVITLRNMTGGALSEAVILNYATIRGAS